ncbi:unnamed protein product [Bursaphelenchus xylophilus]|uniref:(pine wood nematode) hypothetical protein n=1 Tax=Bursaphelenchus xylophilus TaxID=6326 RepID=A0A1I7S3E8_BURXY|nr:unnamed protein product [Bursaphelenchus xylophilus]CAG9116259.1 unnamed protein product [Bursaphelenchus xylophilus]
MMHPFRNLRSHLQKWIQLDNKCSESEYPNAKSSSFFLSFKRKDLSVSDATQLCTPTSGRSVSFEDAVTWPFIDDDIPI